MMLIIRRYLMSSKRMANEAFIGGHPQAFVNFLPYLTSNHSAAMLVIPNGRSKKIKPFRFANYVVDKPEFLDIVNNYVNGFAMFKLVKKLKNMKTHMNKLNWKHGNLFESAKQLKEDLKMAQKEVDRYPYGAVIKANEVCLLDKYIEAVEDEEKLLFQMAKVEWLSKAMEMITEVTDKEIKDTMFDIGDTKAPGPNGYSAMFFKKSQGIIGDDVCAAIKEFFLSDKLPIACCNVIYKDISKILTNRIKEGLHKMVNLNQSAFIPRRLIRDNLLITQEPLKRSAAFYISLNGDRVGYFKSKRGLREGDLVSTYLFTLMMEVFSLIMAKKVKDNKDFSVIKEALDEFSKVSGLIPCIGNSTIFFSNIDVGEIQQILDNLSFIVVKLPMKYLGVRLIAKKLNVNDCTPLIDKGNNKVLYWKNKGLSGKGKATVSWKIMCSPKSEGGLGLKPICQWNKGHLSQFISYRVIYEARLQNSNIVADLIEENQWKWPDSCKVLDQVVLVEYSLKDDEYKDDQCKWRTSSGIEDMFSVNKVWEDMRNNKDKDEWWKNDEMKLSTCDVLSKHEMQ
ncbi:hypothetical protein Tco_0381840 [Tanacetum coccineum]